VQDGGIMSFFLVILGMFFGFIGGYIIGQSVTKNESQKDIQSSLKPLMLKNTAISLNGQGIKIYFQCQ
jgi:hypothetical protein